MTVRAFVIGHPIGHSRSPLIHRYWLHRHGIDGSYEPIDVPPGKLTAFLDRVRGGEFAGGNVTVPHKLAALAACDRLDETAREVGAVNTIVRDDGSLIGRNTDLDGFLGNLDAAAPGWDGADEALVLGAGGAARAVVAGLARRGFERIGLLNRTPSRAAALAAGREEIVFAGPLEEFAGRARSSKLLVNTTTIGMHGTRFDELPLATLPADAVVVDLVYVPLVTPLLAAARARGLKTVDGLGMLLHQAVPAFEAWFGVRPEVSAELRDLVVADLDPTA